MSEQLLTILKFCLLALIYLFFFRVVRAVWAEIKTPALVGSGAPAKPVPSRRARRAAAPTVQVAQPAAVVGTPVAEAAAASVAGRFTVIDPPEQRGITYDIGSGLTLGRAPECQVVLTESFVSSVHARVSPVDGNYVVEDLGSTNGTFLNRKKVVGPMVVRRGDRVQVGNTVLELA